MIQVHSNRRQTSGQPNDTLSHFGEGLARYSRDLVAYLTCADEQPPFPFGPWPGG